MPNEIYSEYARVVKARFAEMKQTAEKAFGQLDEAAYTWVPNDQSNSIAVIVKHMSGHMVSRWTDVLHTDGEKPSRDRNAEFINETLTRETLYKVWDKGWDVFMRQLDTLQEEQLLAEIYINGRPLTLIEAIEKSMVHYSYHTGQIVYIAKQLKSDGWISMT